MRMRIDAKARAKNLTRRTAVVTGGGSGIGTMIASAYVQNGVKVYIASRKEEQLKKVCRAQAHSSPVLHSHQSDVSTPNKGVREIE